MAEKAYSLGVVYFLPFLGTFVGYIFYAFITLYSKLLTKSKAISVGELVGEIYGKPARIITGIMSSCVSLGYVSAQITSIGYVLEYFFHIPFVWGLTIGYGVVITYTTFGGIRSVIFTDVIQFGVMIVAVPLLCNVGISQLGGVSNLINSLPAKNLTFAIDKTSVYELVILCTTFSFIVFNPSFIQRLLIVRDNGQGFKSVCLSAIITIPFFILVIGIGLIAFSMNQELNPNFAFPYLIDQILPLGLKGLVIAGLLSAMMSTADSDLNIIGISIVNDIFIPLWKRKVSGIYEVRIARVTTFIFGIVSIYISLYFKNIIDIILFFTSLWASTILVPLTMSMLGKNVNFKSFLACIASGTLAMIFYNYFTSSKYSAGAVFGVLANLIVFGICYITSIVFKLSKKRHIQ